MDLDRTYRAIALKLLQSPFTVVFTGAGMSTESGLPDFRSQQGLWQNFSPAELATTRAFRCNRDAFVGFYRKRIENLSAVQPNSGHKILAEWEGKGLVKAIITQNVDRLHQAAGSRNVVELHGNLREVRCADCDKIYKNAFFLESEWCSACGGPLRPQVVLFGEALPAGALDESRRLPERAKMFFVLGSSLEVSPANWFPQLAQTRGSCLIIVNRTPTPLDHLADYVIPSSIGTALATLDLAMVGAGP